MQKISKSFKIVNIAVISAFLFLFVVFIYSYMTNNLAKDLFSGKPITFAILINGSQTLRPQELDAFIVYYERETDILKILSINTDAVVIKKKERARSFKSAFNGAIAKGKNFAYQTFCEDIEDVFDGKIKIDYFFLMDYDAVHKILSGRKGSNVLLRDDDFLNRDEQCANQSKIAQEILHIFKNSSLVSIYKIFSNYSSFDTNISRFSFINAAFHFKFKDAQIMFCDTPVRKTHLRLELSKQEILEFMDNVFFAQTDLNLENKDGFIAVENASQKQRAAYNTVELLRDNGFDVLDWSNSPFTYKETLIKDYKGNFAFSSALRKILKRGQILVSYDSQTYYNAAVYIGSDYILK